VDAIISVVVGSIVVLVLGQIFMWWVFSGDKDD